MPVTEYRKTSLAGRRPPILTLRSSVLRLAWPKPARSCFRKKSFRVNTIGFLAHDIVILLDPAEIVENIHDAYSHPHFLDKAYSLLMSGPSGSADIGGITVHPAQGVMTLTVIFWPRAQQPASPKAGY